jgi:hypothetical protein
MSSNERRKRKTGNLATTVTVEVHLALTIVASEDLQVLPEVVEVVISVAVGVPKVAREAETTSEEMVMVVATDLIAQVGIAEDRDTDQL